MTDVDTYTVEPNESTGWDVVRNVPTVVAKALKLAEAEALAFALNVELKELEDPE